MQSILYHTYNTTLIDPLSNSERYDIPPYAINLAGPRKLPAIGPTNIPPLVSIKRTAHVQCSLQSTLRSTQKLQDSPTQHIAIYNNTQYTNIY